LNDNGVGKTNTATAKLTIMPATTFARLTFAHGKRRLLLAMFHDRAAASAAFVSTLACAPALNCL
jgi:hypothetical protein